MHIYTYIYIFIKGYLYIHSIVTAEFAMHQILQSVPHKQLRSITNKTSSDEELHGLQSDLRLVQQRDRHRLLFI